MLRHSINVYWYIAQSQCKYVENRDLDILIKCKYHLKLKELKTNEGSEFKELRNGLCEIVPGNHFRRVMLSWLRELLLSKTQHGLKKIFKNILAKVLPVESSQEQFYVESYLALV